jgi:hypothetical protein
MGHYAHGPLGNFPVCPCVTTLHCISIKISLIGVISPVLTFGDQFNHDYLPFIYSSFFKIVEYKIKALVLYLSSSLEYTLFYIHHLNNVLF